MTAAFGSAAAKTLASDAAMNLIYRYNMSRAFTVAHIMSTNKTAGFIGGKVWDEMEKRVGDKISGAIKPKMAETPANFPSNSKKYQSELIQLDTHELCARSENQGSSPWPRASGTIPRWRVKKPLRSLPSLERAEFFSPPTKSVDDGKLADQIELSLYLYLVLKMDYVREVDHYVTAYWGDLPGDQAEIQTPIYKNTDLEVNPDSPEYSQHLMSDRMGVNELLYKDIGAVIRKKLNELYKKRFQGGFHDKTAKPRSPGQG